MTRHATAASNAVPDVLASWMAPFAACFTRPTWANLLVHVAGAAPWLRR